MGLRPTVPPAIRRAAVLVGLTVVLYGCAGTPFERLWPFQQLDPSGLTRAEPDRVRAAIKLPLPARPRQDGATLVLRLSGGERSATTVRLAMTLVNEGRTVRADRLPSAEPGYWWYLFKLTSAAENELEALQSRLSDGTDPGVERVEYEVVVVYENVAAGQSVNRDIRLQLTREEGFFTLTDGVHTVEDHAAAARP